MHYIDLSSVINVLIVLIILFISIVIFIDCKKITKSNWNSIFWASVSFFIVPPIGLLIYLRYKKKYWL